MSLSAAGERWLMWHCFEPALCPHQTLPDQADVASCPGGGSQGDTRDKGEGGDSLGEQGGKAALNAARGREDDSKGGFASPKGGFEYKGPNNPQKK